MGDEIIVIMPDGKKMSFKSLAAIGMENTDGEYTALLHGNYSLKELTDVEQMFTDIMRSAVTDILDEIISGKNLAEVLDKKAKPKRKRKTVGFAEDTSVPTDNGMKDWEIKED